MRILFMGTPSFAVASLRRLVEDGHDVCGVFTQPDRPKNRGHKLTASPVKEYALSCELPVFQPEKMRDGTALALVNSLRPELIVVAAYGRILPRELLEFPARGAVNVHSSILPKYRGAAPINWAILNGETETGVTIMYMAEGLDTGDIILCKKTAIGPDEDAQELTDRLAELGGEALHEALELLSAGMAPRIPQDDAAHTYAPMLGRELSPISWERPAAAIHDQIRGLIPWPCATAQLQGKTVKVFRSVVGPSTGAAPGTILSAGKNGIEIACGDGRSLFITELQAEGGKRMSAAAYLAGHPIEIDV